MAERPKIIIALNWLRGAKAGDIIHEKEYMKSYGCVFSAMRRLKQLGARTPFSALSLRANEIS
jgi:hypothetical protein